MLRRLSLLLCWPTLLLAQEGRIEQARNFALPANSVREQHDVASAALGTTPAESEDDSFGVQQILKRPETEKLFHTFAEVSGFVTNNVALTRTHHTSDSFLVATFGFECHKNIAPNWTLEASLRGGIFRYNRVSALNFISLDAAAQVTYHATQLGNIDLSAGYDFTDLINDRRGDSFFNNHAIILAAQKAIPLSRAHYLYTGLSATFGFADPVVEQRDEYAVYAGYHLHATRHLDADLSYRYAFYDYSEHNRLDHNQTLSLSVRYALAEWLSVFGSAYGGLNRSNLSVFDYEVGNLGAGLGLSLQF